MARLAITPTLWARTGEPFSIFFDQDVQRLAVERQRAVESGNQTGQVDGLNIDHLVGVTGLESVTRACRRSAVHLA